MNLSDLTKQNLNETRKWTFFFAILGFIMVGLMVIGALSFGAIYNAISDDSLPIPGSMFGGIYLVFAAIYFFPIYYLFKFSVNMKEALAHDSDVNVDEAFKYLKSHYKFIGILTIVVLSIYILIGLGVALVGLSI